MSKEKTPQEEEIRVMAIAKDDPKFIEAAKTARKKIDVFLDIHDEHKDNIGVYFAIKVARHDKEGNRHFLWYNYEKEEDPSLGR